MPLPCTTSEPENTNGVPSPPGAPMRSAGSVAAIFATGTDSPVSNDSSTARFVVAADHRVRGDAVALGKHEEIADDDVASGDAHLLAFADHERPRARQVAQRFERAFALAFLDEGDRDDHEHEREQHRGLALVAQKQVDGTAGDQQQEHGLARNVSGDREQAARFRRREFVVPVTRQPGTTRPHW